MSRARTRFERAQRREFEDGSRRALDWWRELVASAREHLELRERSSDELCESSSTATEQFFHASRGEAASAGRSGG